MPVEGHLTHVSPYESIRKVKNLISRGDVWTQDVVLTITSDEIVIKDGVTRVSMSACVDYSIHPKFSVHL